MGGQAPSDNGDKPSTSLPIDKISEDIKVKIRELGAVSVREIIDQFKISDEAYLEVEKVIAQDTEFVVGPQFNQGRVFRGIRFVKKAGESKTQPVQVPPPGAPQIQASQPVQVPEKSERAPLFKMAPPEAPTPAPKPPPAPANLTLQTSNLGKPAEAPTPTFSAPTPATAEIPSTPAPAAAPPLPAAKAATLPPPTSPPAPSHTIKPMVNLDLKLKAPPDFKAIEPQKDDDGSPEPVPLRPPAPTGTAATPPPMPPASTPPASPQIVAPKISPPPSFAQPAPAPAPALQPVVAQQIASPAQHEPAPSQPAPAPSVAPPLPTPMVAAQRETPAATSEPPSEVTKVNFQLAEPETTVSPGWNQIKVEQLPQMPETHRVAAERLAELLTMPELESLLGINAASAWKLPQETELHRRMLAAMLVHRYDRDLLTLRPLRELLAKKLRFDINERIESSVANAIWFLRKAQLPLELLPPSLADRKASHGSLRSGPRKMKLEDYQIELLDMVAEVLNAGSNAPSRRTLVSLTRGAGKTTSTIVGIQKWFATTIRPMQILWVARSENHADVAVSAFEQAWLRNHMAPEVQYARVWGSHNHDFFDKKETIESMQKHHRSILFTYAEDLSKRANEIGNENFFSMMGHIDAIVFDQCDHKWLEAFSPFVKNLYAQHPGLRLIGLCAPSDLAHSTWTDVFGQPYNIKSIGDSDIQQMLKGRQILADIQVNYHDISQDRILPGELRRQLAQFDGQSAATTLEATLCNFANSPQRRSEIVKYLAEQRSRGQILYFGINQEDAQSTAVELTNLGLTSVYISSEMSDLTKIQMLRAGFQYVCVDATLPREFFERTPDFVLVGKPILGISSLEDILASCGNGPKWRGHGKIEVKLVEDVFAGERMPLRHLHLDPTIELSRANAKIAGGPDDVIETLLDTATAYIDRRSVGGKLWVLHTTDAEPVVDQLIKRGFKFVRVPEGHAATKGKAAWYFDAA